MRESIQHEILTNIGLRDQPILDKFQDEIFRMPLDSQLLILGPPGTGKTTTLIRRLGQKLDVTYLTEAEQARIGNETDHRRSWVMFTPTDLLKHYLKEAFSREQVAASDHNIKTWDAHSRDLARNVLDILQAGTKKSSFILKSEVKHLKPEATESAIIWYESFKSYHRASAEQHLKDAVTLLKKIDIEEAKPLAQKIRSITESADSLMAIYSQIFTLENEIRAVLDKLKQESDRDIRKAVNYIFNQKKELVNEFSKFLSTIKTPSEDNDSDDAYDADEKDVQASSPKKIAVQSMVAFIRAYARATYQKRKLGKGSKNAAIAKWLGNRIPGKEQLIGIGQIVFSQNVLRRFTKLANNFTVSVPQNFRTYRKKCLKEKQWYLSPPQSTSHIGQQELDLIILLMFDCARELLQQHFVRTNLEEFSILKIISDRFKNQILVDEATDFSPIQLACMERLTSLSTGSFFVCGDFNQRITGWGTKTPDEFEWVSRKITHKSINIVYRQSQKLNAFAGELLELMGGAIDEKAALPENVDHEGVPPVLLEQYHDTDDIAEWLFSRIEEIDKLAEGARPTIAVLVNSEEEVVPTANALNILLEDINLQAEACSNGNTIGEGSSVRVFDVQHIKGLEFEAVFFLGLDKLAQNKPDLFDKFLYVGATRAATFLGLACESYIPESLKELTVEMVQTWQ
ncbi:UvrD-helicase domain-containing protein [Endozoicomonas sp.]|uniref:UvrD-helicase domain-containing protein n=1 Tax=Endozoicomonas sp. TaxID=1892382 RepID=UPI003839FF6C